MKMKFEGVHPTYDGEYEFDLDAGFTNREWHIIKQVAGVRVGEFDAALEAGDNDLVVALATIVLKRNGKTVHEDTLWDTMAGSITMETTEAEVADADPPPPSSNTEPTSSTDGSGNGSTNSSGLLASVPSPTGSPPSAMFATSESATSGT